MGHAARSEAMAAADRLVAIGDLYAVRLAQHGEREQWAIDTDDAVAAEVGAALHISVAMGHSNLRYARAMRERLPLVAEVFRAGDIDFRLFRVIVYRTDLVTDAAALAAVDAQLAVRAQRWEAMTSHRLAAAVDRIVAKVDRDAVRRSREDMADRRFDVINTDTGFSHLNGVVFATAGEALDRRLNELAATVCPGDPRTVVQRRADALGALAAGADRLICGCGRTECELTSTRGQRSGVVVHVVADQSALDGSSENPAVVEGNALLPAEVLRELARSARLQPLTFPADAAPEPGYQPSSKLADFVRARDLTCRAPGCDRPATHCDVDHTIPHSAGGLTHASNLKCLCRFHHLLKTFWGWSDKQLPDGTVIWTAPSGQTYVTTPGSALLFPSLTVPTGDLPASSERPEDGCGERTAMMPNRRRTRRQDRSAGVRAERAHNQRIRKERHRRWVETWFPEPVPPRPGDEPPPF